MRYLKALLLLSMLLTLAVGQASADALDPQIIVRGGVARSVSLTGQTVQINFSGTPGCDPLQMQTIPGLGTVPVLGCGFVNNTGNAIVTLMFTISPGGQLPLTLQCFICSNNPIGGTNGGLAIFHLNLGLIGPGDDFWVDFVNFSANTTLATDTNKTPEPGTLALMFTGAGALLARRRLRKGVPVAV